LLSSSCVGNYENSSSKDEKRIFSLEHDDRRVLFGLRDVGPKLDTDPFGLSTYMRVPLANTCSPRRFVRRATVVCDDDDCVIIDLNGPHVVFELSS
jgi:hypothetical protein